MSLYVPEIRSQKPEVRSGHICFVFRGHVFIWGGFNEVFEDEDSEDENEEFPLNQYISSDCLWIYNINTCTWKQLYCVGEIPRGCSGACASVVGQTLYVFGGHCASVGHLNCLYSLDLVTLKWKNHSRSISGQPPLPRDKFGSWVVDDRIIYFGGYGSSPPSNYCGAFTVHEYMRGWNGQTSVLNIRQDDSLEWTHPLTKGDPPQPRAAHGMTRIGNKGFLFGGRHSVCRDNDLHCLDLENFIWSGRLQVSGPEPCGRSWHVFVKCGPKHILVHGGFDANNKELDDAWLLDVESLNWIEIDAFTQMRPPRTRLWHTACQTENEGEIAIFGGCSSTLLVSHSQHTNDLFFFHFAPPNLQRLCEEVLVKNRRKHVIKLHKLPKQISRNLKGRLCTAV